MKKSEYLKIWRSKNKEYEKNYYKTDKGKYVHTKKTIKAQRGLILELSFEEWLKVINQPCHYCGNKNYSRGLDRVNNNLGYLKDNIVSCCEQCNYMKSNYSVDDFINKCEQIVLYWNEKNKSKKR